MISDAMIPFGRAMRDYFEGKTDAQLMVCRDDGLVAPLPVSIFFREPDQFTAIEREALSRCTGSVLDVGAGSGLHSLALQRKGFNVTALDVTPQAVEIMHRRGVSRTCQADVFSYREGPYDTVLLLGHGIGMVETLDGLRRFLLHAQRLVTQHGQILLDSLDVERSEDPQNRRYHELNRQRGRYPGEIRLRFDYEEIRGRECGWLHIDPVTLAEQAATLGWSCTTLLLEASGQHLSRLGRSPGTASFD
jgi:SAM-dependent methyltransferase